VGEKEMNNPCTIPTSFKVPKGFKHRWLVYGSTGELIQEIRGVPGRRQARFITYKCSDECKKTTNGSCGLDWMVESVEHMRFLCENPC